MNGIKLKKFNSVWDTMGVWLICILLFCILASISDNFLTSSNLINVARQICVTAVVALGAAFVVLGGEIDLSQGSMVALIGCFCAKLMTESGMGVTASIIFSLALGTCIGILSGLIVTYLRVQSFISTLGLMYALAGVVILITNSQPVSGLPEPFMILGRGYIGVIPVPVIILALAYAVGAFILKYTAFGRNVLVVGENKTAAKLSGVNVYKIKIMVFAMAGFASALGGIILASRLSSGQPSSGSDVSLLALAAVFVGGASKGSVMNTLAGALIIGLINNGLNLLEVNGSWQKVALGAIIVAAVALDVLRSERSVSR